MGVFLLDTHTLLWARSDDPQLSPRARQLLSEPASELLVSLASLWEIAIKASRGRIELGVPFEEFVRSAQQKRVRFFPIEPSHTVRAAQLPFHHADPFDRMLIAQSLVSNLPVIGRDLAFDDYGVERIW